MQQDIHDTSIISSAAVIGRNVKIGPFCTIGAEVILEEGVELKSHVVIEARTTIGSNTVIYPFASIGQPPQILKYEGEKSKTIIGSNNTIREYVTIQAGSKDGGMITSVGNNCLLMVGAHVAHDCRLGNNIILANYVSLAGHVEVGDYVVIGGLSAVHQYARIGKHAMIGGMSALARDLIPFGLATNERACLEGLNLIGMKRHGFDRQESLDAIKAIDEIFIGEGVLSDRIMNISDKYKNNSIVGEIIEFLQYDSSRAFCAPKK